jgi:hypothetical protein
MNPAEVIRAIADEVSRVRPDWKPNGVQAALWQAKTRGGPDELRAAALRAAADPSAKTPAAIGFDAYWSPSTNSGDDRPRFSGALPECIHCGKPAKRDATPKFCGDCGKPWQSRIWDRRVVAIDRARIDCPGCGRGQYAYTAFCSECGHRIEAEHAPPPPKLADRLARIAATHIDDALPDATPDDDPTMEVDW